MAASYVLNTKAEFLKSKKTAALWITIIGAMFIPTINFLMLALNGDHYSKGMKNAPWEATINQNWQMATAFLVPMYVILVTSLLVQIEYKNNTWKQVYASPRSNADIFFSKFFVINTMLILCFLSFNMFIIFYSYLANLIDKRYTFFSHPIPWLLIWSTLGKVYFSILAITAIQYWLCLRFKNFIVPLGIGLGLLISGYIGNGWKHLYIHPYMYSVTMTWDHFTKISGFLQKAQIFDAAWFMIIIGLAYFDTANRKERG